MGDSGITYAPKAWNVISGCSPEFSCWGHCWAKGMARRLAGRYGYPAENEGFTPGTFHAERLNEPLTWREPQTAAVNFMGDMFHRDVKEADIEKVFDVMHQTPQHTYLVLTKRADRMAEFVNDRVEAGYWGPIPAHIRMGVSVSNQPDANRRVTDLLRLLAEFRWISAEPLLGPISLDGLWGYPGSAESVGLAHWPIRWVVAGCESGPGARPMNEDWVRSLRDQCQTAGALFMYKQKLGPDGRKIEFPELDGYQWTEIPQ